MMKTCLVMILLLCGTIEASVGYVNSLGQQQFDGLSTVNEVSASSDMGSSANVNYNHGYASAPPGAYYITGYAHYAPAPVGYENIDWDAPSTQDYRSTSNFKY